MTPVFLVLPFLKNSPNNSRINIVNVTEFILVTVLIVTTSEQLTAAFADYLFSSLTQKS